MRGELFSKYSIKSRGTELLRVEGFGHPFFFNSQ
jgi:hypothetical protein